MNFHQLSGNSPKRKKKPRLTAYLRAFGNVSYKYDDSQDAATHSGSATSSSSSSVSVTWSEFCSSVDSSSQDRCKQLRQLVQDVIGSEEGSDVLDAACLDFVQLLADHQRMSLDLFKSLKLKYGNLSQNNAQKIFSHAKELNQSASSDVIRKIKGDNDGAEEDFETGDYFGKNIPYTDRDNSDFFSRFDLSYLRPIEEPGYSLNNKITFNIDVNAAAEEANKLAEASASRSSGVDTLWLESTIK